MKDFFDIRRRIKRLYKNLGKREKFVLIAALESIVFFIIVSLTNFFWILFPISFVFIALATIFALYQELSGFKYIVLPILPIFFWGSSVFFVGMATGNIFGHFLAALMYGIFKYSLLLTLNIYNVAAIRTIQLVRAANAVGLLFTLFSAFFIYSLIWSINPSGWVLVFLVAFFSFPLILQSLWSIELENYISKRIIIFASILTLTLAELAFSFTFWPILPTIGALALVSALYVLLGITHFYLIQRLKKKTIWEYLGIASIILIFIMLTTRWGG